MSNLDNTKSDSTRSPRRDDASDSIYLTPMTDILENDSEYLLLADVPGAKPGAVAIELNAGELLIEAKSDRLDGTRQIYRRAFRVGTGVDPDGISAELKQGVLRVVAKKNDSKRPRQIAVRAG